MRKAQNVKTARSRAAIAIEMLRKGLHEYRAFDDCFEMGDGTEVVKIIVKRALNDGNLYEILRKKGFDSWLTDEKYKPATVVQ